MDDIADDDYRGFVERLTEVERLAGKTPLLVMDQFENLFQQGIKVHNLPFPSTKIHFVGQYFILCIAFKNNG